MSTYLSGKAEVAFRDFLIPADAIESVKVAIEEGERKIETLAGTFTSGNGLYDASAEVVVFLPSMDWLGKNILKGSYNVASPTTRPGNVILGGNTCSAVGEIGAVNIHYVCDTTDKNDVYFYNATLKVAIDPEYNQTDALKVTLTFNAQVTDNGQVRLGTGNLTADAHYNVATKATVANS